MSLLEDPRNYGEDSPTHHNDENELFDENDLAEQAFKKDLFKNDDEKTAFLLSPPLKDTPSNGSIGASLNETPSFIETEHKLKDFNLRDFSGGLIDIPSHPNSAYKINVKDDIMYVTTNKDFKITVGDLNEAMRNHLNDHLDDTIGPLDNGNEQSSKRFKHYDTNDDDDDEQIQEEPMKEDEPMKKEEPYIDHFQLEPTCACGKVENLLQVVASHSESYLKGLKFMKTEQSALRRIIVKYVHSCHNDMQTIIHSFHDIKLTTDGIYKAVNKMEQFKIDSNFLKAGLIMLQQGQQQILHQIAVNKEVKEEEKDDMDGLLEEKKTLAEEWAELLSSVKYTEDTVTKLRIAFDRAQGRDVHLNEFVQREAKEHSKRYERVELALQDTVRQQKEDQKQSFNVLRILLMIITLVTIILFVALVLLAQTEIKIKEADLKNKYNSESRCFRMYVDNHKDWAIFDEETTFS